MVTQVTGGLFLDLTCASTIDGHKLEIAVRIGLHNHGSFDPTQHPTTKKNMTDTTSRLIVRRLPFFSLVDCHFVAQLVDFCEMGPILAI